MDQLRLILLISISFVSLMLWEAWQKDYGPIASPETPATASDASASALPVINNPGSPDAPPISDAAPTPASETAAPIVVETDVLVLEINPIGGGIQRAALRRYSAGGELGEEAYPLLDDSAARYFVHQSGLKATAGEGPDHYARFAATSNEHKLAEGESELKVDLIWQGASGIRVTRTYAFKRGSYAVDVTHRVENTGSAAWSFNAYEQLQREHQDVTQYFIQTFTGAAVSTPEQRYEKFTFDDLLDTPVSLDAANGWAAILEHYFVSAIIPAADAKAHYYSSVIDEKRYLIGYHLPQITVAPGDTASLESRIFMGPKLQKTLSQVAPGLELTVDYGMLWFIGKLLYWILDRMYALTSNWGVAIILLTCIVKGVFYPLSAAGYRSMAKMRRVQPRMVALRERYPNDRAALNQAMMDLYKTEKINPLGGCLPILVQIPVFIALYWVILESVELRQAPFIFWIHDLSAKDPWFVLPVLMTLSMWLQTRLNPAPVDPIQARVMQVMPFAFGAFFAFFPSALVLYWFVNNCLSITQQWTITRKEESRA